MLKFAKSRFFKRICPVFLIMTITTIAIMPFTASAASIKSIPVTTPSTIQPLQSAGLSGFGMSSYTTSGSFTIPVSGPTKSTGGITIKALNCSSGATIIATIYRQNGSVLSLSVPNGLAYVQLTPGDSDYLNRYQFSNADAENYYIVFASSEPVNILCWIYG